MGLPKLATNQHPPGLSVLFFTEMWERFSFYGMRALLVLYLVNALEVPREQALHVYASYTGLVYLTPILGGYLADRYLGKRRAVMIGGIVMALGHFAMAFPSMLYFALGLLIAGNGFFKPNISTMVGEMYGQGDNRRDAGFTIFYMGINLGAFLAPLVCGTLAEKLGWHFGFAAAGVGMLLGLVVFVWGQQRLKGIGLSPMADGEARGFGPQDWKETGLFAIAITLVVGLLVLLWPPLKALMPQVPVIVWGLLGIAISLLVFRHFFKKNQNGQHAARRLQKQDWQGMAAILIVGVFVVFFWMGFEQAGGTMNLFADSQTDRNIYGWEMPASYFQSLNPLFILLLAPLFSILWTRLDRSSLAISPIAKQAIGMIILGLGFVVLAFAQERADAVGLVGPGWLVLVFLLHTMGELCLSPIGLSMVSRLAPAQLVSLMMGVWMTVYAIASYMAGILESLLQDTGWPLYWFLVIVTMGAGGLLLLLTPLLNSLMPGD